MPDRVFSRYVRGPADVAQLRERFAGLAPRLARRWLRRRGRDGEAGQHGGGVHVPADEVDQGDEPFRCRRPRALPRTGRLRRRGPEPRPGARRCAMSAGADSPREAGPRRWPRRRSRHAGAARLRRLRAHLVVRTPGRADREYGHPRTSAGGPSARIAVAHCCEAWRFRHSQAGVERADDLSAGQFEREPGRPGVGAPVAAGGPAAGPLRVELAGAEQRQTAPSWESSAARRHWSMSELLGGFATSTFDRAADYVHHVAAFGTGQLLGPWVSGDTAAGRSGSRWPSRCSATNTGAGSRYGVCLPSLARLGLARAARSGASGRAPGQPQGGRGAPARADTVPGPRRRTIRPERVTVDGVQLLVK